MDETKVSYLMAYVNLLVSAQASGHHLNREITEAVDALRKELGLSDSE